MKKATYTLVLEYDNGDVDRRGGLTQTKAYALLQRQQDKFWTRIDGRYIVRWKIDSGWQEITE